MGIPLGRGRVFSGQDAPDADVTSAVVSASFAARRWPNADPIGKLIQFGNMDGDLRPFRVVGVVGDVRTSMDRQPQPILCAQPTEAGEGGAVPRRAPHADGSPRADPGRPGGAARGGPAGAPHLPHNGPGGGQRHGGPAVRLPPPGGVRGDRARAGGERNVRGRLLPGRAAGPGTRRPHRLRRAAGRRDAPGGGPRGRAGRDRDRGRDRDLTRPDAAPVQPAVRRHLDRSGRLRGGGADPGRVRPRGRWLPARRAGRIDPAATLRAE